MLYILLGITVLCALLGMTEIIVRIWEKVDRSARRTACAPTTHAAQNAVHPMLPACLPDRDAVKNIYSLPDQFADHFWEVVHS